MADELEVLANCLWPLKEGFILVQTFITHSSDLMPHDSIKNLFELPRL